MAKHSICHVEWSSTNLQRARVFFSELFDWKFEDWGEGYTLFRPPEGVCGGVARVDKVAPAGSPVVYVEVDEIEPYLDRAKGLGGGVAVPRTEIPTVGWFAHLTDPDGNLVGLFKSNSRCKTGDLFVTEDRGESWGCLGHPFPHASTAK